MKKIIKKAVRVFSTPLKIRKLNGYLNSGLPRELESALIFLISGNCDVNASKVSNEIEELRKRVAAHGDKLVEILYSPKPGSAGTDPDVAEGPAHGERMPFTMTQVAKTGKDCRWGTALHLLSREFKARHAVELGTCAGISARYLSSTPTMEKMITIEGSTALYKLASENLSDMHNVEVVNSLFDDAISNNLEEVRQSIDLAYIDGHHEKIATIRYFNRMLPYMSASGVVIFDDISWSQDMREGWKQLSVRSEFSHCIDLGAIGIGIIDKGRKAEETPKYWNLQNLVGRAVIGNPHGWQTK